MPNRQTKRLSTWIISGCCSLLMVACGGPKTPKQLGPDAGKGALNTLTEIKVNDKSDKTIIEVRGAGALSPNVFKLTDPLRVIIDFTDTKLGEVATPIPINNGVVNEVTASQFDDVASSLSRIVIGFDSMVDYQVSTQESLLTISIPKTGAMLGATTGGDWTPMTTPGKTPESIADVIDQIPVEDDAIVQPLASSEPAIGAADFSGGPATQLKDITYSVENDQTNIRLVGNGSIENFKEFTLSNPPRLVVDVIGLKSKLKGKSNISVQEGGITRIRAGAHPDKIRVVIELLTKPVGYQVAQSPDGLMISFGAGYGVVGSEPTAPEPLMAAPTPPRDELQDIGNLPIEEIPVEDQALKISEVEPSFTPSATPEPAIEDVPSFPAEETVSAATMPSPISGAATKVLSLDFVQITGNSRLIIKSNAPINYTASDEGADTVIINLINAKLMPYARRFLNTSSFNSPVVTVVPKQIGRDARIVASLREGIPYKVSQDGNFLYIDFERNKQYVASEAPPAQAPTGDAAAPAEPATPDLTVPEGAEATQKAEAEPAAPQETPEVAATEDDAMFNSVPEVKEDKKNYEYVKEGYLSETMKKAGANLDIGDDMIFDGGGSSKNYTGRKINLDFKEADIRSLFRLFADISKLNIIVGDDVTGKVTIRLRDVPWDQAFSILLQTQSLGAIKYGNILRIAPAEKIQKERELHAQAKKAAVAAAPMDTLFKAVSYANATEVASHVRTVLSERGTVNIDTRTNTLIVRDVREKLVEAKTLIDKLDAQTPQVTIEARIVEANDSFVRNWGVQWGGQANFSPATGNPTGLLFPNSVNVAGSQSLSPVAGGRNPIILNYPAVGANAGVTLNLGSINNVLDLDLLLGYQETEGNIKLISSPKVTVLDNRTATISSGTRIPFITQTSNSGNNVRFESAAISINVTPHITADGAVIMQVNATRNEPDFGNQVLGNPTIVQREANTEVLVKSGNTTVIGGVYRTSKSYNTAGFPFLRRVPIIGWLFKSDNRAVQRQELLIFITPRIVGDERTVVRQVAG